jgi:hypothetical protein
MRRGLLLSGLCPTSSRGPRKNRLTGGSIQASSLERHSCRGSPLKAPCESFRHYRRKRSGVSGRERFTSPVGLSVGVAAKARRSMAWGLPPFPAAEGREGICGSGCGRRARMCAPTVIWLGLRNRFAPPADASAVYVANRYVRATELAHPRHLPGLALAAARCQGRTLCRFRTGAGGVRGALASRQARELRSFT